METSSTGDVMSSPAREEPSSSPLPDEDISSIVDQSERSSEYSFAGIDEDQSTDDDKTLIMEGETTGVPDNIRFLSSTRTYVPTGTTRTGGTINSILGRLSKAE